MESFDPAELAAVDEIIRKSAVSFRLAKQLQRYSSNPKNQNLEICKKCKGVCCKACGCHYSTADFKEISFDFLKEEIQKGYISIVYGTLQDTGFYYLRIRNVGEPIVYDGGNYGECCLLSENGCKFSFDERPTGGKMLIPDLKVDDTKGIVLACINVNT